MFRLRLDGTRPAMIFQRENQRIIGHFEGVVSDGDDRVDEPDRPHGRVLVFDFRFRPRPIGIHHVEFDAPAAGQQHFAVHLDARLAAILKT